jgi:BASS family bile acid:Na+ symporter
VIYHLIWRRFPGVAGLMPIMSMFGIVYYTAITTAAGREELLKIGGLLVAAVAVHNAVGFVLGYWVSRAVRLDRQAARTVAIEVGLQNGGMATGIAAAMGKVGTLGLAAAIFSPWMNVSGSILANYWRRRPVVTNDDGALPT